MSTRSKKVAESEFAVIFTDDSALWLEWSDATLNKENWTVPKNGSDNLFVDTQSVQLPPSLVPHEWIRVKDLTTLTEPLVVFVPDSNYSDLITNNKHLFHSEFARWFVSALINLEHCGRNGLEISGENGNFIWNGRYQSWRGWTNVYSMNKAGKGAQHRPTVNPNGKYVVRLYFLGSWRRIVVDDMIPVNAEGIPLLPRTSNDFELWPMLLSKALLKLCSLTWTEDREIVDFHPVTCLTGWVFLRLDISYLSPQDKWDFLRKYADHFEWEAEVTKEEGQEDASTINNKEKKSKGTVQSKKSKDTARSKKSKDTDRSKKSEKEKKLKVLTKPQPVTLFLGLEDMREVPLEDVPGLSPCWGHFVYVEQSRDKPLDPKDVKPPLARWKLYRWLRWAIGEGIIDPAEYFVPIRSLKVVSPLKKCKESVINKYNNVEQNSQYTLLNQQSTVNSSKEPLQEEETFEETSGEISFWADFNKMEPHVRDIHFFYKLDYFQYTMKLSDRFTNKQSNDQRSETKKSSRKSSPSRTTFKDPEFVNVHCWPEKMSRTRNDPLYVLTDSVEEKFFLVNFSTFQVSVNSQEENDNQNSTNIQTGMDYLIVEKHNWFRRPQKSNCLVSMLTAGTRSVVMELNPGRHLLRMYCRSETNCFVTVSSDTMFHVGDRRKMYQLMSTESQRIEQLTKHISNCVSNAYQSFGTEKYPEALKAYYNSYLPPVQSPEERNKVLCDHIHDYFMDEKVHLIRKSLGEAEVPDVLRSLRIFFLNPAIGLERFNLISRLLDSFQDLNQLEDTIENNENNLAKEKLEQEQAATAIQSYFKMLIIRKYKQMHDPQHQHHSRVLENLFKVVELFNYNKRESLANQLLRNILKHHDKLVDVYPFSKDCEHTLQVQEVRGALMNVKPNHWLPIMRLVVNCRATETVLAAIDMFADLPRYCVRVFNNDTGREMLRVVNNVVSTSYQYSSLGYTILCYGWSKESAVRELPWTLNVITVKQQPVFYSIDTGDPLSLATVPPALMVEEFSSTYIPNSQNDISKLIVRVAKPGIVSFRLKTSYEQVRMKFSVTDDQKNVVAKVTSTSVVILPMVYLGLEEGVSRTRSDASKKLPNEQDKEDSMESGSRESLDYRTYHAQAKVLDDSWPLTKAEWIVVMEIREGIILSDIRSKLSSVSHVMKTSKTEISKGKRGSKPVVEDQALEPPFWVLQVVTDVDGGLEISQDRTKEQEIARMKEAWAKENPDSLARGRKLREAFLKKYQIVKSEYSMTTLRRRSSVLSEKSVTKSHRPSFVDASEISMLDTEPRTLTPPSTLRRLPALDLTIYEVREDEEDTAWVRTEDDEETLRNSRALNILYANEDHMHFMEEIQELLRTQKDMYKNFFRRYMEQFWENRILSEEAYEARDAYVRSKKAVSAPVSKKASSRKSKKSKKN